MQFSPTGALVVMFMVGCNLGVAQSLPVEWKLQPSPVTRFRSMPVESNGGLIFKDENGKIRCASLKTGKVIWEHESKYICGFAVADNAVYVADSQSTYGLNLADGTLLWSVGAERKDCAGIAVLGKNVITTANPFKGTLTAYDRMSGEIAWENHAGIYFQQFLLTDENSNRLLLPTYSDSLLVVNGIDGKLLMKIKLQPYDNQASIKDGKIYALDFNSKTMFAIDIQTGKRVWSTPERGSSLLAVSDCVITDGIIYHDKTNSYTYYIKCFNSADGRLTWEKSFDMITSLLPSNIQNGQYIFVRHQSVETGEILATYSLKDGTPQHRFSLNPITPAFVFRSGRKLLVGNTNYPGYLECYEFPK